MRTPVDLSAGEDLCYHAEMAMIEAKGLSRKFGEMIAVDSITFSVEKNIFF